MDDQEAENTQPSPALPKPSTTWRWVGRAAVVLTILFVIAVGALFYGLMHSKDIGPVYEGDLPFDKAQSIEEYQAQIEPIAPELLNALEGVGFADASIASHSTLGVCGDRDVKGFEIRGPWVSGSAVNLTEAAAALDPILTTAGFDDRTERIKASDDGVVQWYDRPNGGSFAVDVAPGLGSTFRYESGCRPAGAPTTSSGRAIPVWEMQLTKPELRESEDSRVGYRKAVNTPEEFTMDIPEGWVDATADYPEGDHALVLERASTRGSQEPEVGLTITNEAPSELFGTADEEPFAIDLRKDGLRRFNEAMAREDVQAGILWLDDQFYGAYSPAYELRIIDDGGTAHRTRDYWFVREDGLWNVHMASTPGTETFPEELSGSLRTIYWPPNEDWSDGSITDPNVLDDMLGG